MRLEQLALTAVEHVLGRLLRRLMVAAVMLVFALIAVYYLLGASEIALSLQFGELHARLIMGGIFAVLALAALVAWWTMRGKARAIAPPQALQVPGLQVAMLVEAVMLGYALARGVNRAPRG
jgi:hypothetical protein